MLFLIKFQRSSRILPLLITASFAACANGEYTGALEAFTDASLVGSDSTSSSDVSLLADHQTSDVLLMSEASSLDATSDVSRDAAVSPDSSVSCVDSTTCGVPEDLGGVRGDDGTDELFGFGNTERWHKFRLEESKTAQLLNLTDLTAKIKLTLGSSDFTFDVLRDDGCSAAVEVSSDSSGEASVSVNDKYLSNQSTDFWIHVKPKSATCSTSVAYEVGVAGHQ